MVIAPPAASICACRPFATKRHHSLAILAEVAVFNGDLWQLSFSSLQVRMHALLSCDTQHAQASQDCVPTSFGFLLLPLTSAPAVDVVSEKLAFLHQCPPFLNLWINLQARPQGRQGILSTTSQSCQKPWFLPSQFLKQTVRDLVQQNHVVFFQLVPNQKPESVQSSVLFQDSFHILLLDKVFHFQSSDHVIVVHVVPGDVSNNRSELLL